MKVKERALQYDVIGIDEGQFFPDIKQFCELMADYGKMVVVAALDGTFLRKPFNQILDLIPICDSVKKLRAICMFCGKEASFSLRTSADVDVEVIGGADIYKAVCRECYHRYSSEGTHKITEFVKVDREKSELQNKRKSELKQMQDSMILSLEEQNRSSISGNFI